jgi:hypothetical protein
LPTPYENIKGTIQHQIAKTKSQLAQLVKRSRNNYFGQLASNARSVKFRKVCDRQFIGSRKLEECRNKSAFAACLREQISTASKESREKMISQRINSANEVRARSRAGMLEVNKASFFL